MNIKETFLALTSKTYPYGFEDELEVFLPKGYTKDENGNYFYKVGESKTAFTCHLDTACKDKTDVIHVFDGDLIRTNGKTILGADDKAGVTILLYMIEKNFPGLYCFFVGEEVGCIGSGLASVKPEFKEYNRMISFDRRGTGSVITFQSSKRCCSENFAKSLSKELNNYGLKMSPDDTGVYTDSAEFTGVIPECTNISVGYYREHTHDEHQDIKHLITLCNAAVRVDWENLPTQRNPKTTEYKSYKSSYGWSSYDRDYSGSFESSYSSGTSWKETNSHKKYGNSFDYSSRSRKKNRNRFGYHDDWYDQNSSFIENNTKKGRVYYNNIDNDITDVYISSDTKTKGYYEALKQIIFDDRLSRTDFERVKEQYLDMSDPKDVDFYLEMKNLL